MKKSFFIVSCLLICLVSLFIGSLSLKGVIPPNEKRVTILPCMDNKGNTISYGNTCEPGGEHCGKNPCPWDKIQ